MNLARKSVVHPEVRARHQKKMEVRFGNRLRALREERGWSQEELAKVLGFNNRQTVSAIENGARRLTADDLMLAMEKLDKSLDYFTDPFRLVGEGQFSWRQDGLDSAELEKYEQSAGCWIAAYRELAPEVGHETRLLFPTLWLTSWSTYEDAAAAGECFVAEFGLGDKPARQLARVVEKELGALVLMVDTPRGVSGASFRLPEVRAVLISRDEVLGRRNFDLAHELFHLLTWDTMPPERADDARRGRRPRVEQLADSFAGGLLMPASSLEGFGDWSDLNEADLIAQLNSVADELEVSSSALRWRLVTLKKLPKRVARSLPPAALRYNGHSARKPDPPPRFSKPFATVMARAMESGFVSSRRAARVLDMTLDDVYDLFDEHEISYDLGL